MREVLRLEHIQKYYGNGGNITKAIRDISFSVAEGEFLGIMGASGSGKTTLLNCISTIDMVSAGHIFLDGQEVTEIREKEIARRLNIEEILDRYPWQVSGGQKQRCACARAVVNHPKLILADEPTGALDSHSSRMLLGTISGMNKQLGATILMVTHDAFSASYAKRILFLRDGEIFTEIRRGTASRKVFFDRILDVLTMMGGGSDAVL